MNIELDTMEGDSYANFLGSIRGSETRRGYTRNLRIKKAIPRLKKDRFAIAFGDEVFFVRDNSNGRKYWSQRGTRIKIPYSGSRQRLTVFGAVTDTGKQFFRSTTSGFNSKTFVSFVRGFLRRFKKVVLILDKTSAHRSKLLKRKFGKNKNNLSAHSVAIPQSLGTMLEQGKEQNNELRILRELCRFVQRGIKILQNNKIQS